MNKVEAASELWREWISDVRYMKALLRPLCQWKMC